MSTLKNFARKARRQVRETRQTVTSPEWHTRITQNAVALPLLVETEDPQLILSEAVRVVSHSLIAFPGEVMERFDVPKVGTELTLPQVGGFAVLARQILAAKLNAVDALLDALSGEAEPEQQQELPLT